MYWAIGAVVAIFLTFCIGFISGMTSMENALLKEGFKIERSNVADAGSGRVWIKRRNEYGTWKDVGPIERGGPV